MTNGEKGKPPACDIEFKPFFKQVGDGQFKWTSIGYEVGSTEKESAAAEPYDYTTSMTFEIPWLEGYKGLNSENMGPGAWIAVDEIPRPMTMRFPIHQTYMCICGIAMLFDGLFVMECTNPGCDMFKIKFEIPAVEARRIDS